jgi:regulator of protease activity HflC (stomatin/prohibitin superfamily)
MISLTSVHRLLIGLLLGLGGASSVLIAAARWASSGDVRAWCLLLAAAGLIAVGGLLPTWLLSHGRVRVERERARAGGAADAPAVEQAAIQLRADAGWPQALAALVPAALALALPMYAIPTAARGAHLVAVIAALAAPFPLLVADSLIGQAAVGILPEREALRRLIRVPIAIACLAGLALLASAMGMGASYLAQWLAVAMVAAIAAELVLRAGAHLALGGRAGRACADSLIAGALLRRANPVAAVDAALRERFGIDLGRSWSARVLLRAAPWVAVGTVAAGWGLSGVSVVPLGSRLVLDGPGGARVLGAGAHLHLPWPFRTLTLIDDGRLHVSLLGQVDTPLPAIDAQADPPPAYDRLWEVAHPAELDLMVPAQATAGTGQGFRAMAGDVRVQWTIGPSDADAVCAVSRLADVDADLSRCARRALTGACALLTLESLIGADRDRLSERLRAQVQSSMDALADGRSGIRVLMLVIDSIHPPAGAALAYQAVQASEIAALATIAKARAAAARVAADAAVSAGARVSGAQAAAAESTAAATAAGVRFAADARAWRSDRDAIACERWLQAVRGGISGRPLVLLDAGLDLSQVPHAMLMPPPWQAAQ